MSYDPERQDADQPSAQEDQETGEHTQAATVYERFRTRIEAFFDSEPNNDWIMLGEESGAIMDSGTDSALPTKEFIAEIAQAFGEKMYIFGRPILIEPTSPDPNSPSER